MKKKNIHSEKKPLKKSKGTYENKKKQIKKGTVLECKECGMTVIIDEICGCVECHPLICCGEEMIIK